MSQLKISRVFQTATVALALAIIGAGCSMHQDPYADQSDAVKNRVAPEKDKAPPPGKADKQEALWIDADDNFEFKEGAANSVVTIGARVSSELLGHDPVLGQDYTLSIDNLADFPGASFDAPTGQLTWSPRPGFVQSNYTRNVHFDVTLTTKFSPIRKTTKSILAVVTRSKIDPSIVSIEDLSVNPIHEGEARVFKVVVRDPHADDQDDMRPLLTVVASDNTKPSAAGYITQQKGMGTANPTRDPNDPTLWNFNLVIDLRNKELTTGKTTLGFGLVATSRYGEASPIKTGNATVITSLNDPLVTWPDSQPIDVVAGKENTVTFSVFDPKAEGNLSVNFTTRCDVTLGGAATCSCAAQPVSASGIVTNLCTIRWSAPAIAPSAPFEIDFSSLNQSKYDSQQKQTPFVRYLRVVQPGKPVPPFVLPATAVPAKQNSTQNSSNNTGGVQ